MLPEATISLNGKKSYDFDIQANQLSDILCRGATVSSVQSTNNTLTRNSTLRDTGDYDVPHPHPYTHHYMTTSTTPQAMSIVGSSPQGSCENYNTLKHTLSDTYRKQEDEVKKNEH